MKIAIDLTSLADNFSGIERMALNISLEMLYQDKHNRYVLLFKEQIYPAFKNYINEERVECIVLPRKRKLWFYQVTLLNALMKIDADIFLFLAFPSPFFFRKKGIVNTIHDLGCWDCPETMMGKMVIYFRLMDWNSSKKSQKILTISKFSQNRILQLLKIPEDRIQIIYPGVSENLYGGPEGNWREIQKKYGLPERYIMCLSTLEPRKNMKLLIEAFSDLTREKEIDCSLLLAGRKGWKLEEFLDAIPEFCKDRICITGYIEDEDLPCLYRHAEVFVFPSIYEGFGIPPLEAMAVGCPVICSDIEVLKEILGEYGIYFQNRNRESLKIVLKSYLDGEMPLHGRNDLIAYSKKYTYEESVKKLLNVFTDMR